MPDVGMVRRFGRLLSRLHRNARANVAATFAIAIVPLIASIGCAIDYSMATRIKAKLQSSADAASVASISVNSAGYNAAMAMTSNGSVAPRTHLPTSRRP